MRLATAYVMPLGGKDVGLVLEALDRNKRFIKGEIARRINLRYAPDIRFRRDDTFEEASRIDALLHSEKVRRDLDADHRKPKMTKMTIEDASESTHAARRPERRMPLTSRLRAQGNARSMAGSSSTSRSA